MTQAELNITLVEYAKEDLGYAKEDGQIAIAQTLEGLINISYSDSDETFQAFNNKNEQLTYMIDEGRMINWLIGKYDVSEVEVVG